MGDIDLQNGSSLIVLGPGCAFLVSQFVARGKTELGIRVVRQPRVAWTNVTPQVVLDEETIIKWIFVYFPEQESHAILLHIDSGAFPPHYRILRSIGR